MSSGPTYISRCVSHDFAQPMHFCGLSFTEFINNHHPKDVLDVDEFLRLRNQVFVSKSALQTDVTADDDDTDSPLGGVEEPPPGLDAPPGEEPPPGTTETASKVRAVSRFVVMFIL